MAKAELKTKKSEAGVEEFLNEVADESVRANCEKIAALMEKATGAEPKMWGKNIVGFGEKHLTYESGRELDWFEIGFSPRKANMTLYLNFDGVWDEEFLSKLGNHKLGKGCLYIKRLGDIDEKILENLIEKSVEDARKK